MVARGRPSSDILAAQDDSYDTASLFDIPIASVTARSDRGPTEDLIRRAELRER